MNAPMQPDHEQNDAIIGTALTASLVMFSILACGGFFAYQYLKPVSDVTVIQSRPSALPQTHANDPLGLPLVKWSDITESSGIHFTHQNGAVGDKLLPETMGGGCAFFDYDNDGDQDLLFVNSRSWSWDEEPTESASTLKLYANDGTGIFEDVTTTSGLNVSMYGMGVACGDYDADGWVDLFISCVGGDHLYRNDAGHFIDVTETAGVGGKENAWSSSCGWFDYDRDGDLDLFVAHYVDWSREYDEAQDFTILGDIPAYGRPQNFEGTFPTLFRNDGQGSFTDVSEAAGLHVVNMATNTPLGKSLGVVFEDFDEDGDPDIFVSNDTVQNFLFVNQSDGTFLESGTLAGVAFNFQGAARGAMGVDVARFRNDGSFGVAIGNFANEMSALYVTRDRNLQFYDEAVSNGFGPATRQQLSFGVLFLDIDLDGRLDLFQANGHLEEEIHRVQSSQTYQQSPQIIWNTGPENDTEFASLPELNTGSAFTVPLVGRGAAYADIDADGDLDLIVATTGQKPRLLRNEQDLGHHWLRVKLKGALPNLDAIGAVITITTGDLKQTRTVSPTRGYLSQVELPVTFGLGESAVIDELRIRWPDGSKQRMNVIDVDQFLEIEQQVNAR